MKRITSTIVCACLFFGGCASSPPTEHVEAAGALGPYSGAVRSGGFCFLSGKIGERGGTFASEADTALDAVEQELAKSGLTFADLVSVTVYVTDMGLYGEFNEIYARRLGKPYPARAVVGVRALPGGARVEIQSVARLE